jgi:hypothetical protein
MILLCKRASPREKTCRSESVPIPQAVGGEGLGALFVCNDLTVIVPEKTVFFTAKKPVFYYEFFKARSSARLSPLLKLPS